MRTHALRWSRWLDLPCPDPGLLQKEDCRPRCREANKAHSQAPGAGADGTTPMPGTDPESRAVIDERQWASATSAAFIKAYATFGISQPFTRNNNPNGSADMERLMRTLKEELLLLRKWPSALDLERALAAWVDLYHTRD